MLKFNLIFVAGIVSSLTFPATPRNSGRDILDSITETSKSEVSVVINTNDSVGNVTEILNLLSGSGKTVVRRSKNHPHVVFGPIEKPDTSIGTLVVAVKELARTNPRLVITKPYCRELIPEDGGILNVVMNRNAAITSGYGWRVAYQRLHKGIDIACNEGDTVCSLYDGIVVHVGDEPKGYGRYVVVKHEDGIETRYAHLKTSLVMPQTPVCRGEAIGLAGNSGNSTGPHLHFEIRRDGKAFNPFRLP